jgi:hypothetical protein
MIRDEGLSDAPKNIHEDKLKRHRFIAASWTLRGQRDEKEE